MTLNLMQWMKNWSTYSVAKKRPNGVQSSFKASSSYVYYYSIISSYSWHGSKLRFYWYAINFV